MLVSGGEVCQRCSNCSPICSPRLELLIGARAAAPRAHPHAVAQHLRRWISQFQNSGPSWDECRCLCERCKRFWYSVTRKGVLTSCFSSRHRHTSRCVTHLSGDEEAHSAALKLACNFFSTEHLTLTLSPLKSADFFRILNEFSGSIRAESYFAVGSAQLERAIRVHTRLRDLVVALPFNKINK